MDSFANLLVQTDQRFAWLAQITRGKTPTEAFKGFGYNFDEVMSILNYS